MVSVFDRYIGIDYSGAQTPTSSLKGIRVYVATPTRLPEEVQPPPSPRKYWSRKELAEWLVEQLKSAERLLVGIDHGFSFPLKYFERHRLPLDWEEFLEFFQMCWPTAQPNMYVDFIRDGSAGLLLRPSEGNSRWRRLAEVRVGAKSVFHFDVPGSVAKSTHAGLPWLLYIMMHTEEKSPHFWPFEGWALPQHASVIAEVYPSLWSKSFPKEGRTGDQHDAYSVAAWMRQADQDGSLPCYFAPILSDEEREIAEIEGWILGVR
jgi:hypothetical protein